MDFFSAVHSAISGPMFGDVFLVVGIGIGAATVIMGLRWILAALGFREGVGGNDDD